MDVVRDLERESKKESESSAAPRQSPLEGGVQFDTHFSGSQLPVEQGRRLDVSRETRFPGS